MDLSRILVMPPLAALHVSRAATTRTLHSRRRVALNIVSLFRLVVLYNDLILIKAPKSLSGFLLASWRLRMAGGRCNQVLMKQPISFDPLKGLTRLLTLVEVMKRGGESL